MYVCVCVPTMHTFMPQEKNLRISQVSVTTNCGSNFSCVLFRTVWHYFWFSLIPFLYSGILNLPAFLHLSSPLICPRPLSTKAMSIIGLRHHQQGIPPICHPFTIFPNSSLIISAFKIKVSKSPVIS